MEENDRRNQTSSCSFIFPSKAIATVIMSGPPYGLSQIVFELFIL